MSGFLNIALIFNSTQVAIHALMHIGVATEPEERHFVARLLVIFEEVLIKFSILENNRGVQYSLVKLTFLIPKTKKGGYLLSESCIPITRSE